MESEYLEIFNHFGVRTQMKKLNEECYELLEAIDLYEDVKGDYSQPEALFMFRQHVIEEMGDLLNVLKGFAFKYKILENEIAYSMSKKVDRTLERIKSGYYE